MSTRIVRHGEVGSFLKRAMPWLIRTEIENSLVLGIALRMHIDDDLYVATVEQDGVVVGCALRTPPRKLLLTRMPPSAVAALAVDVGACYQTIPGVQGPPTATREFARQWCDRHGCIARDGMAQRLYSLRRVRQPDRRPEGELRPATDRDAGLIASWIACFAAEAGVEAAGSREHVADRIATRDLCLWWDAQPRTLAGYSGRTPNGVRIGYVYTPPEWRGRGYASACVAALSSGALAGGASFCCLYTDLSNPTSNSIYTRLGYESVCDAIEIHIDDPSK